MKSTNMKSSLRLSLLALPALALALLAAAPARAQAQQLPVPSQGLPGFLPGMQEVPDPGLTYRVVFDMSAAGPLDKIHPTLAEAARYLNTLATYGAPPIRRKLAIVLHGAATQFVLKNAAFAARNHGKPNPDAALISAMKNAGVDFRVCGQAVLAEHIAPKDILPAVQLDLWALSSLVNLQLRGYVRVGGG
ncbi:MAG TPA: DsrE family protein [Steroidobacteraceae bacterium]|jgi:intracellular sulfur oxidation DsrE/DsrF family protein|nr:DsrE family protein [Steroidobacteraceae bacterium]